MTTDINLIKQKLEELQTLRSSIVKELKDGFSDMLKPILSKFNTVSGIWWTQYTPYFNDGDT